MRKLLLVLTLLVGSLISATPVVAAQEGPPPAAAAPDEGSAAPSGSDDASAFGEPCPPLTGVYPEDSYILYTYSWIQNGCQIPIRRGFYSSTGFGWDHIEYKRVVEGQINHQLTDYARDPWAQALVISGSYQSNGLFCHRKHYVTPGGSNRTMRVLVSSTNYAGQYGPKGIITAYWVSGHVGC